MKTASLTFENIGNLSQAKIKVALGCLNIKFGSNGIGKTTLIKALKYEFGEQSSEDEIEQEESPNSIIPLRDLNLIPTISSTETVPGVLTYDRNYFSTIFENDSDVLHDTYKLVVKSGEYDDAIRQLRKDINSLVNYANNPAISNFMELTNKLFSKNELIALDSKGKKVKKNDSLFKSYATVGPKNVSLSQDSNVSEYSIYVSSPFASSWLAWLEKYKFNILQVDGADICPFCGQRFDKANLTLKENLDLLRNEIGKSSELNSHNEEQKMVIDLANYCVPADTVELLKLNDIDRPVIKTDLAVLDKKRKEAKNVSEKLGKLRSLDGATLLREFNSAKDEGSNRLDKFKQKLASFKITEGCFIIESDADKGCKENLIQTINSKIDDLISGVESLANTLVNLNRTLQKKIKDNEKLINDFLKIAGIPYQVEVVEEGDESFLTLLKFSENDSVVRHRLDYLSFGEANAFALILFAIEARKSKSWIILDDPVSSFDSNKRYAIYDYLFDKATGLLYGKTVLLMTHDFQTVVTFAKSKKLKKYSKTFSYLINLNNKLFEEGFEPEDICSSVLWYKNYAVDGKNDTYSRIVALRRATEIESRTDSDFYNFLASLVHCYNSPKYKDGSDFSTEVKKQCDELLMSVFGSGSTYEYLFQKISDSAYLIENYRSEKASRFSKACITRLLIEKYKNVIPSIKSGQENLVAWNFMCESFHVETQYIYSIKGISCEDIPNYIISLCDSIVAKIELSLQSA